MMRAAILGSPVSHSLSPTIHNRAYEILGVRAIYEAIDLQAHQLEQFILDCEKDQWLGFSLTMPLKEHVVELYGQAGSIPERISSGNTLLFTDSGCEVYSTDYLAFERLLPTTQSTKITILGGGGTARAALAAVDKKGNEISVYMRDTSKGRSLKRCVLNATLEILPWPSHFDFANRQIVLSTVPRGATDSITFDGITPDSLLFESLYHPFPTPFLQMWRERGGRSIHGLDLLVEQALDQISLMTNRTFSFDAMRGELLKVAQSAITSAS